MELGILTDGNIRSIVEASHDNYASSKFIDISCGYIRFLLSNLNIQKLDRINGPNFINRTFPDNIAEYINTLVDNEDNPDFNDCIIEGLIGYITDIALEEFNTTIPPGQRIQNDIIFPWDIQYCIGTDEFLSNFLHIPAGSDTLPLNIVSMGNSFLHQVTKELAYGMVIFLTCYNDVYRNELGRPDANIQLSMFGELFPDDLVHSLRLDITDYIDFNDQDYVIGDEDLREKVEQRNESFFVIQIKYKPPQFNKHRDEYITYYFETPDFIQGIITISQWLKFDHHPFWKNCRKFSPTNHTHGQQLTF